MVAKIEKLRKLFSDKRNLKKGGNILKRIQNTILSIALSAKRKL